MSDIINCYHKNFSGGIGDFIKGSVYLYSQAIKYGMSIDMDWKHHPIGKHIYSGCKIKYNPKYIIDIEDLQFTHKNKNTMGYWLHNILNSVAEDKQFRPATISSWYSKLDSYPYNRINHINKYQIGNRCKEMIKNKIRFTKKINLLFEEQKLKNYGITHFRLGDRHTLPKIDENIKTYDSVISNNYNLKEFNHDYDYYYYLIKKEKRENNLENIIVMSDSNDFKRFISEESKNKKGISVLHFNSGHTANQPGLLKYTNFKKNVTKDQYKYTALDLKIIINSLKNITYSCYNWGSGFVVWPSKLYDIPLDIKVLNNIEEAKYV